MTLLQQIQMEVVDSSSDLASVLRKCRILAQRLGHEGFKEWVIHELEGYPIGSELPEYRVSSRTVVLGHFFGAFGRRMNNVPIPASSIPDEVRKLLTQVRFPQGVAAIKQQLDSSEKGILRFAWPAEAYQIVGQEDIIEDMNLMQAFQVLSAAELAGVLDRIRNKILTFVLELESRNPEAGEAVKYKNQIPPDQVQHIFNTVIKGDVTNMAQGSSHFSQQAMMQVKKGDIDSLIRTISELGIDAEDVDELRSAVTDESNASKAGFGKKVTAWIGKIVSKAAQGAYTVSTNVAGSVIAEALKKYYGI